MIDIDIANKRIAELEETLNELEGAHESLYQMSVRIQLQAHTAERKIAATITHIQSNENLIWTADACKELIDILASPEYKCQGCEELSGKIERIQSQLQAQREASGSIFVRAELTEVIGFIEIILQPDAEAKNEPAKPSPQGVDLRQVLHDEDMEFFDGPKCSACGTKLIDDCLQCGAPQCCPKCCNETTNKPTLCECAHWARADMTKEEFEAEHHPNCPKAKPSIVHYGIIPEGGIALLSDAEAAEQRKAATYMCPCCHEMTTSHGPCEKDACQRYGGLLVLAERLETATKEARAELMDFTKLLDKYQSQKTMFLKGEVFLIMASLTAALEKGDTDGTERD